MQLRLTVEGSSQSWTLKPSREYILGSGAVADIQLSVGHGVAPRHVKLSFDMQQSVWMIEDLSGGLGTQLNSQPVIRSVISQQARICLGGSVFLSAVPERAAVKAATGVTQVSNPAYQANDSYMNQNVQRQSLPNAAVNQSGRVKQSLFSQLSLLTWAQYVERQVKRERNWFDKILTRFEMVTGFREHPWVPLNGGVDLTNGGGIDGYVIPNFQGSSDEVIRAIETQFAQADYQDTDCFIAELTDIHMTNSARNSFDITGVISRSGRADFRRFCVVSYNNIRTYLTIEKYGPDLFVNWMTRFEPIGGCKGVSLLVLFLCGLLGLASLYDGVAIHGLIVGTHDRAPSIWLGMYLCSIWPSVYFVVPRVMQNCDALPKKTTAILCIVLFLLPGLNFLALSLCAVIAILTRFNLAESIESR
jgi:pSer/pThr/pTyr-binding forkhead associated (FHA) protein